MPCIFFLLPDKMKQMLRLLLESFESSTSSLFIETIHIDQEAAIMAEAVRNTPNFVIKFCHFHIRQSWLRKIQTLDLITDYKNEESDIVNWLKLFLGLPALSYEEVDDLFAFCLMVKQPESENAKLSQTIYSTITSVLQHPSNLPLGLTKRLKEELPMHVRLSTRTLSSPSFLQSPASFFSCRTWPMKYPKQH